jgi:glycosyltransferase involved in cell wall biosynthesis
MSVTTAPEFVAQPALEPNSPPARFERAVVIDWQLSSYFGWGINGLHFTLNWALQQPAPLITSVPVNEASVNLNPLEWQRLRPALAAARDLQAQLYPLRGTDATVNLPVLHGIGNGLGRDRCGPLDIMLSGTPSIALAVFEFTEFTPEIRERARAYELFITPSTWNRDVLESAGIGPTVVVPEGIDPTAFHPAPKAGLFAGRFAVFSGGKIEYRKGHDLILKAFRIFAARHPDALLVTAWGSFWPQLARSFDADPSLVPVTFHPDGRADITAWAAANGIPPEQFIDLGVIPNRELARIYRETDVALFPNRCEGGTNMIAMECMACSVPVILSANTGHLDLISADRCYPLRDQRPIVGGPFAGWGESRIEEIVETLETVYRDRAGAAARAARAAAFMSSRTWAQTTRLRADAIAPYCQGPT